MARHYSSKRSGKEESYSHKSDQFNDEMHHDKGMASVAERYKGGSEGYYSGPADRLKQEAVDGSMIREDHGAVANLPQNVIMRPYRKGGYGMPEGLNDTIVGIDKQMMYDDGMRSKHMLPKKV